MNEATRKVRDEIDKLPGITESELDKLGPCAICGKPLLDGGSVTFYRVRVEHCGWDAIAVEQQAGLAMMLGGSVALARVMGPNRDLAKVISDSGERAVHERCATVPHLSLLFEEG